VVFLLPKIERSEELNKTGKLVACSVFIAFGVLLPIAFHLVGALGPVFLPMHIPVLIAGLFLGGYAGFTVGVIAPILSSLLTGMPPVMPMLPAMAVELAAYGAVGGYLYQSRRWNLLGSLIGAMVIGRFAAAIAVYCMVEMLNISLKPSVYIAGSMITGFPGMVIQLVLVPLLVKRLQIVFKENR
jgi:riboflavin transporter FmnP